MLESLLMNMAALTVNVKRAKNSTTAARKEPYIAATASRQARRDDCPSVWRRMEAPLGDKMLSFGRCSEENCNDRLDT